MTKHQTQPETPARGCSSLPGEQRRQQSLSGGKSTTEPQPLGDHPHNDPGDGRTECDVCGKWVHECIHSCKGVPVTDAAMRRWHERQASR